MDICLRSMMSWTQSERLKSEARLLAGLCGVPGGAAWVYHLEGVAMDELQAVEIAEARLSAHDEVFGTDYKGVVTLETEVLRALLARVMRPHD